MTKPSHRPLYARIEAVLLRRLSEDWTPGTLLPTEFELAGELGVSQGTVRRALGLLERRRLIERRPGRGTVVTRQTSERSLYHFFRIGDPSGVRVVPSSSLVVAYEQGSASGAERDALRLASRAGVHRVQRVRSIGDQAMIFECLVLPVAVFPLFVSVQ